MALNVSFEWYTRKRAETEVEEDPYKRNEFFLDCANGDCASFSLLLKLLYLLFMP